MNADYTYCLSTECIHRRGCKRWIGNYTEEEVHKLYSDNRFVHEVDYEDCINSHNVYDGVMPYFMLDRFRLSDGTEMEK